MNYFLDIWLVSASVDPFDHLCDVCFHPINAESPHDVLARVSLFHTRAPIVLLYDAGEHLDRADLITEAVTEANKYSSEFPCDLTIHP